jgi:large subunit ribosomal protein L4
MQVSVYNIQGSETGKSVSLSDEIFAIEPNQHVLWLDVKQYLANQRQGTHKSKQRAEIARTTKKLKRQKGTGGARAGSMKSPLFVGGGRVFGPQPRDYRFKLNKKVKQLARKSALSAKVQLGAITVLENFSFEAPQTKSYLSVLNALSLIGTKTLLVLGESDKNVYLSSRNIPKANVITANELTTYDVLNADRVLLAEGAIPVIESLLS